MPSARSDEPSTGCDGARSARPKARTAAGRVHRRSSRPAVAPKAPHAGRQPANERRAMDGPQRTRADGRGANQVSQYKAVCWDFGGVVLSSPFDGFARYEEKMGLPKDFIR